MLICLRACSHSQGVGVLLSLLPASLFEHLSMGQARNPPTLATTLCVSRDLMPTLAVQPPHVCHRQRDWAVSIGSHMQHDVDISKAPPHLGAPLPLRHGCRSLRLQRMFSAPPGASTVVIKHDKGNTSVQRTTFTHVTFQDGLLCVHQCGLP